MATLLPASCAASAAVGSLAASAACTCFRPVPLRSGQNSTRSSRFCSVTGPKRMISIARPCVDRRAERFSRGVERGLAMACRRAPFRLACKRRRGLMEGLVAGTDETVDRAVDDVLVPSWRRQGLPRPLRNQHDQACGKSESSEQLQKFDQRVAVRLRQRRQSGRARPALRRHARGSPRSGCGRGRHAGRRCGR